MGKRSNFPRIDKDHYPTPREAVLPLLPHLPSLTWYCEPCGDIHNALCQTLREAGHRCVRACNETEHDARTHKYSGLGYFEHFITNPPWTRELLHPIIVNLSNQKPTWLLFDADWVHTKQSVPYLERLVKVVSIGRVKWIKDSPYVGKDNACWYLFDKSPVDQHYIEFIGRR